MENSQYSSEAVLARNSNASCAAPILPLTRPGAGVTPKFSIKGRDIGPGKPTYIIAELSGNHGGSLETCLELVREAHKCGADAIKLQTLTPSGITLDSKTEHFVVKGTGLWDGRTLHSLYEEIYTPWEWHVPLKELANSLGMDMFSSPFSVEAVDFLEDEVGVDVYKVASFESGDTQLLARIARTGKPVILSSGLATLSVLEEAVNVLRSNGAEQICLLKCTSAYPADPRGTNLSAIPELSRLFGVVAGLSDHTLGPVVPVMAVTLGANVIEKHFILDRGAGGPDSSFSLEPKELKEMIEQVRIVEQAMGVPTFGPGSAKERTNTNFRRSLFVAEDVKAGEVLTRVNVRSVRPSVGLHVRHFEDILGTRAVRDITAGTPLTWDIVARSPTDPVVRAAQPEDAIPGVIDAAKAASQCAQGTDFFSLAVGGTVTAICAAEPAKVGAWDGRRLKWWAAADAAGRDAILQATSVVAARYRHPLDLIAASAEDVSLAKALGMSPAVKGEEVGGTWVRRY